MNLINTLAWGLILGGTIGNFVDRLNLGYVLDFIRLDFVNFPIFNIADASIFVGVAIILVMQKRFFSEDKEETPDPSIESESQETSVPVRE